MFRPMRPKPLMPTLMDKETPPKQDERRTSPMLGGARTETDGLPARRRRFAVLGGAFGHLHQPAQAVVDCRFGELHALRELVEVHLGVGAARSRHVQQSERQ